MCVGNPFAFGWLFDCNDGNPPDPPISIFGALPGYSNSSPPPPSLSQTPSSTFLTFRFTPLNTNTNITNRSILNSVIFGPSSHPFYRVCTDPSMPDYTLMKNASGTGLALVEWQDHPLVEVRGDLIKQGVRGWLKLSEDKTCRNVEMRGARYTWIPRDTFVCLYSSPSITEPPPPPPQPPPVPSPAQLPELVAKISRQDSSVFLEISVQAVRLGLLNLCLTATLLLQSGRNID